MVTQTNFLDYLPGLKPASFDDELKMLHFFVMESTEMGTNWAAYSEPEVRPLIDQYFVKLNVFLGEQQPKRKEPGEQPTAKPRAAKQEDSKRAIVHKQERQAVKRSPRERQPAKATETDDTDFELTERIPDEIRFIRRYVSMYNKKKTKHDLLLLINALHRAMAEKRIRKTSRYAKQILYIQDKLVKTFNSMNRVVVMPIPEKVVSEFKELIAAEKVYPSVLLLKRYMNLNGKYGVKDKAKALLSAMEKAVSKGRITKSDRYYHVFDLMHENLSRFIKNKNQKILSIVEPELNGLNGVIGTTETDVLSEDESFSVLNGTDTQDEASTESEPQAQGVMNSMDFERLQFKTIGFTGKYRDLIGDPSPGFTAMVFGRPKMGKSHLCVDFAGYLARNHGRVLYVAKEEGLDYTLQEKLKANGVAHPNLDIAETIPEGLDSYDFIFLDSVNSLALSTADLLALKEHHPATSFIYVFQTTKAGAHRGDNEFQHNVDVVIEVPQLGVAVQHGRFNQGGKLNIFEAA